MPRYEVERDAFEDARSLPGVAKVDVIDVDQNGISYVIEVEDGR